MQSHNPWVACPDKRIICQVDASGRILRALHDPTGEGARTVTAVTEHAGRLYLGSLAKDLLALPVVTLAGVQGRG